MKIQVNDNKNHKINYTGHKVTYLNVQSEKIML